MIPESSRPGLSGYIRDENKRLPWKGRPQDGRGAQLLGDHTLARVSRCPTGMGAMVVAAIRFQHRRCHRTPRCK